jgi:lysine/ornithine N-monooxygenase
MPEEMELRAAWKEMALVRAGAPGSLEEWSTATGVTAHEPMAVAEFVSYARWFADKYVPERVHELVSAVQACDDRRLAVRAGGGEWYASEVVAATGIGPFPHIPPVFASAIEDPRIDFAHGHRRPHEDGRRVAVVGAGQSAVEAAAAAVRSGAETTLLARSAVHWFADHEPSNPRGPFRRRLFELAYPAVGYGPPPLNRLVLHPDLFARLPASVRRRLTGRLLRPGASPWLKEGVVGKATIEEDIEVQRVECAESGVRLTFSDGRELEFDEVRLGTGYRFRLDRLTFFSGELRDRIRVTEDGWPVLDAAFRSTEPRVRLVGYPAEGRFGPLARFVLGVPFTAERVARTPPRS